MKRFFIFFCIVTSILFAAPKAYVVNSGDSNVSVIDTGSNTVIKTIPVGNWPVDVAVSPDGSMAYVVNQLPFGHISIINTTTDLVINTIQVAPEPSGVTFAPDGLKAYVTHDNSPAISVIDTVTNIPTYFFQTAVPPGSQFQAISIMPDGTKGYVVEQTTNSLFDLNLTNNQFILPPFQTGVKPTDLAIIPNGSFAYVVSQSPGTVLVIDTATNALVVPIPLVPEAHAIDITPDGLKAFITHDIITAVTELDTTTNSFPPPALTIVGAHPGGIIPDIAITPDGAMAYMVDFNGSAVIGMDTSTYVFTLPIPVGKWPLAIAITPSESTLSPAIISYILD